MSMLTDSPVDLGRKGVVWLDGAAVPVRLTGAGRAVARLVDPDVIRKTGHVATAAADAGERDRRDRGPDSSGAAGGTIALAFSDHPAVSTLQVGGRRRKDALSAIDRWYRREARERIEAVTRAEAGRLELQPGRVTIRDQKTRWGSCSTSGTLSFNWRLTIGPGHALRYVVIHELIHIRHHNHSRAFWNALTEALPDWRRSADWLRANERLLTAYRPQI